MRTHQFNNYCLDAERLRFISAWVTGSCWSADVVFRPLLTPKNKPWTFKETGQRINRQLPSFIRVSWSGIDNKASRRCGGKTWRASFNERVTSGLVPFLFRWFKAMIFFSWSCGIEGSAREEPRKASWSWWQGTWRRLRSSYCARFHAERVCSQYAMMFSWQTFEERDDWREGAEWVDASGALEEMGGVVRGINEVGSRGVDAVQAYMWRNNVSCLRLCRICWLMWWNQRAGRTEQPIQAAARLSVETIGNPVMPSDVRREVSQVGNSIDVVVHGGSMPDPESWSCAEKGRSRGARRVVVAVPMAKPVRTANKGRWRWIMRPLYAFIKSHDVVCGSPPVSFVWIGKTWKGMAKAATCVVLGNCEDERGVSFDDLGSAEDADWEDDDWPACRRRWYSLFSAARNPSCCSMVLRWLGVSAKRAMIRDRFTVTYEVSSSNAWRMMDSAVRWAICRVREFRSDACCTKAGFLKIHCSINKTCIFSSFMTYIRANEGCANSNPVDSTWSNVAEAASHSKDSKSINKGTSANWSASLPAKALTKCTVSVETRKWKGRVNPWYDFVLINEFNRFLNGSRRDVDFLSLLSNDRSLVFCADGSGITSRTSCARASIIHWFRDRTA